jgi:hypothetical protein
MSHTVTYNSRLNLIETKMHGNLDLQEAREIMAEIGHVAEARACFLCLSDYRGATLDMSTVEIYDIPSLLSETVTALGLSAHQFKRALVVDKGLENFHFLETVTYNSGQQARLFHDIDAARKWLLEE